MWRDDEHSNSIEIVMEGLYPQRAVEQVRLKVSGDGSLEFFLEAMKAALIAFGYAPQTVEKLKLVEGNEE